MEFQVLVISYALLPELSPYPEATSQLWRWSQKQTADLIIPITLFISIITS
jgi:hypothetical protein